MDLRIVDPDMKDVPHDGKASGEIVLRAPWLTQGYFNDPNGSEQLWEGGYLHTSDVAAMTPEGYVQITDRIKDVSQDRRGMGVVAADRRPDHALRRRG